MAGDEDEYKERYITLLEQLLGIKADEEFDWSNITKMPRYWREGKFPLHECVDTPDLPCPACLAAAAKRRRKF